MRELTAFSPRASRHQIDFTRLFYYNNQWSIVNCYWWWYTVVEKTNSGSLFRGQLTEGLRRLRGLPRQTYTTSCGEWVLAATLERTSGRRPCTLSGDRSFFKERNLLQIRHWDGYIRPCTDTEGQTVSRKLNRSEDRRWKGHPWSRAQECPSL